ncbi:flagellin [Priestia megaterium]|uniref:flagellin n=1 Tax=Priestia megaterium TaxID=1404 RepID=UPI002E1D5E4A|nr:flagellin [Priestia megaterium]
MLMSTDIAGTRLRNVNRLASEKVQETINRLTTGIRINSAVDDSAGLQLSTRLQTKINYLKQTNNYLGDIQSLAKAADGTLSSISEQLIRIRELAIQYKNEVNSESDLKIINKEVNQILDSINNIAKTTTYNNIQILNQPSELNFNGIRSSVKLNNTMDLNKDFAFSVKFKPNVDQSEFHNSDWNYLIFGGNFAFELGFFGNTSGPSLKFKNQSGQSFSTIGNIHFEKDKEYTITSVKKGTKAELYVNNSLAATVTGITGTFSSINSILIGGNPSTSSERSINGSIGNVQAWNNTVTNQQIQEDKGQGKMLDLHFNEGIGDTIYDYSGYNNNAEKTTGEITWSNSKNILSNYILSDVSLKSLGLLNLNLDDPLAIKRIDIATNNVTLQREKFGIYQNQVEYEINNNNNNLINMRKSKSKVMDTDFATETSVLIKEQLKEQTSLNLIKSNNLNRENAASLLIN